MPIRYIGTDVNRTLNPLSNNNQDNAQWLSMSDAAAHTPYSAEYLSLLARKGKLVSKKVNGVWYTTKAALDEYMHKQMLRAQVLGGGYTTAPLAGATAAPAPELSAQKAEEKIDASLYDEASLKKLKSFHADIREYMQANGLPLPREEKPVADAHEAEKMFASTQEDYGARTLVPEYLPQVAQQNVIADTLGAVRQETHSGIEKTLEKVLDKKLGQGPVTLGVSAMSRLPLPRKSWKTVTASRALLVATVILIVGFSTLPVPFVFSSFEDGAGALKKWVTDANTVMGYRPGTHKDEILLLDKDGKIAITGDIETGGQLKSYVADGTAPIVVTSKTQVDNLNATYLNGASSTDFTLAFVTKNGAVTTEDVSLLGSVEVGKQLLVKGATKLLSSLSVGGGLSVFGDAELRQALTVLGPAHFKQLVSVADNLSVDKNIHVRGSIDAGGAVMASSGSFGSLGVDGDLSGTGAVTLGSPDKLFLINSKNISLNRNGDVVFQGSASTTYLTVSGTATSTIGGPVVFTGSVSLSGAGSANFSALNVTGSTTLADLLVTGSTTLQDLTFQNATGSAATTTSLFASAFSSLVSHITSLVAGDISVGALTATNSTTTSATTTNFFSTAGTVGNLAFTLATGSAATTTNFYSATGTFDRLYVNNYQQNNGTFTINSNVATGDIFSVFDTAITNGTLIHQSLTANAGNGQISKGQIIDLVDSTVAGGGYSALTINVTGTGIGSGAKTLLDLNPGANKEIVFDSSGALRPTTDVSQNTVSIGSPSFYFKNGYFDTITSNSISGTLASGQTNSHTWTIGAAETGDVNEAFIFQRNSGSGNALFQWNASNGTLNDQRFLSVNYPFNATYTVNDSSIATSTNLYSGLLTNNTTSGTQKLLSLTNTGTGSTEDGIYIDNTGTGVTGLEVHGTWATGIKTNNNSVDIGTGALLFGTATGTAATTTNFFATTASSTNLFSTTANLGALTAGSLTAGTITSGLINGQTISSAANFTGTITATGGLTTLSNLLLTGSSTLQNFTFGTATGTNATTTNFFATNLVVSNQTISNLLFTNATGTAATTTSLFSTTASSTNLFSTSANFGNLLFTNATGTAATTTNFFSTIASSSQLYAANLFVGANNAESDESRASVDGNNDIVHLAVGNTASAVGIPVTTSSAILSLRGVGVKNAQFQLRPTLGNGTLLVKGSGAQSDRISDGAILDIALAPDGGNVGIGTSNPQATLEVSKNVKPEIRLSDTQAGGHSYSLTSGSSTKGYFEIFDRTTAKSDLTIDTNGNVGIGTTTPSAPLEVRTTNTWNAGIHQGIRVSSNFYPSFRLHDSTNNVTAAMYVPQDGGLSFGVAGAGDAYGTQNFVLSANGDVGLGGTVTTSGTGSTITAATLIAKNGGNVGIGTTNPARLLTVNGGAATSRALFQTTASGSTIADGLDVGIDPSENAFVWNYETGPLEFGTSNNERMRIDASGNVGIGTTTPDALLSLNSSGMTQMDLLSAGIQDLVISGSSANNSINSLRGNDLLFQGNSTTRMVIQGGTGNVGIGTTSPASTLQINAASGGDLRITRSAPGGGGSTFGSLSFGSGTGGNTSYTQLVSTEDGTTNSSNLQFYTASSGTVGERMRIASSGNVGIGTTNPNGKLQIAGDVSTDPTTGVYAQLELTGSSAPADRLSLGFNTTGGYGLIQALINASAFKNLALNPNGGNVGIGTTNPGAKLEVNGSTETRGQIRADLGTTGVSMVLTGTGSNFQVAHDGTSAVQVFNSSGGAIQFRNSSDSTTFLHIDGTGNIGIGTTNPDMKLFVMGTTGEANTSGSAQNGSLRLGNSGGNGVIDFGFGGATGNGWIQTTNKTDLTTNYPLALNPNGGNVGIGTTNPGAKLDVAGQGAFSSGIAVTGGAGAAGTVTYNGAYGLLLQGKTGATADSAIFTPAGSIVWDNPTGTLNSYFQGNVGIGNTNPLTKMEISADNNNTDAGQVYVSGASNEAQRLTLGYNTTSDYGFINAYKAGFGYKNLSLMPSGGNVGIGTTNPQNRLDVFKAGGGSALTVTGTALGTRNDTGIDFAAQNSSTIPYARIGLQITTGTLGSETGGLAFSTINSGTLSEKMFISAAGNVGIGTTNPQQMLDVNGNIITGAQNNVSARYDTSFNYHSNLRWNSLQLGNNGANDLVAGRTATNGYFRFFVNNTNDTDGGTAPNGTLAMTIDSSGNAGIGVTAPPAKLSVVSSNGGNDLTFTNDSAGNYRNSIGNTQSAGAAAGNSMYFNVGDSGLSSQTRVMTLLGNGNVGIGTTGPNARLEITGGAAMTAGWNRTEMLTDSFPVLAFNSANTKWGGVGYDFSVNGGVMRFFVGATSNDVTATAATPLSLDRTQAYFTGNVGIGVASPGQKLEVNGAIKLTNSTDAFLSSNDVIGLHSNGYMYVQGGTSGAAIAADNTRNSAVYVDAGNTLRFVTSGNEVARFNSSGNLGIGITNPSAKLEVNGGIITYDSSGIGDQLAIQQTLTGAGRVQLKLYSHNEIGTLDLYDGNNAVQTHVVGNGSSYFNGGNVGIGTTAPKSTLDVAGEIYGSQDFAFSGAGDAGNGWSVSGGTTVGSNSASDDSWYYQTNSQNWSDGLLSTRRFRRTPGLTLEWEEYADSTVVGSTYHMTGFASGDTASYTYSQTPTNILYESTGSLSIYENGGNVASSYTFNPQNTWVKYKVVLNGSGASYYVYNNGIWNLMATTSTNSNKYVRVLIAAYSGRMDIRGMRVYQQNDQNAFTSITTTGNVGIGITNPGAKLVVQDASSAAVRASLPSGATTGATLFEAMSDNGISVLQSGLFGTGKTGTTFGVSNANLAYVYTTSYTTTHPTALAIGTNSNTPIIFGTSGAEKARIDGSGNVGIGVTNPTGQFEVAGSGTDHLAKFTYSGSTNTAGAASFVNSSTAAITTKYGILSQVTGANGTNNIAGYFNASGASNNYAIYAAAGKIYAGGSIDLAAGNDINLPGGGFGIANASTRFLSVASGAAPDVVFNGGGAVGIGVASVTSGIKLQVNGTGYYSTGVQFANQHGAGLTCGASNRGLVVAGTYIAISPNVDTLWICAENTTAGTYVWNLVFSPNGNLSTSPDLAEYVPVQDESISGGEIVAVSDVPNLAGTKPYDTFYAERASAASKNQVLGVVSTNPGYILNKPTIESSDLSVAEQGASTTGLKPLALAGRVPVKVTTEAGEVHRGDYVTVSDTVPGKGMKAVHAGTVLGQALDDYDPSTGEVLVLVGKTYYTAGISIEDLKNRVDHIELALADATSTIATLQSFASTTAMRLDAIEAKLGSASSTGLTLDATSTSSITSSVLASLGASIVDGVTHFKDVVVAALTVGSQDLPSGITIYDTATGAPYCITVENGTQRTTPGKCGAPAAPVLPNPVTGNASSTPVTLTSSADTATSTASTTDAAASSTPTVDTASSTPSTNTASSSPVVASTDTTTATSTTP